MTPRPTAYALAHIAGCSSPDSQESPGAKFLNLVFDVVEDYRRDVSFDDAAHEIADGAVPVYTHQMWQTFVDLAAYTEDTSELALSDDLSDHATAALYLIGRRLAFELLIEL